MESRTYKCIGVWSVIMIIILGLSALATYFSVMGYAADESLPNNLEQTQCSSVSNLRYYEHPFDTYSGLAQGVWNNSVYKENRVTLYYPRGNEELYLGTRKNDVKLWYDDLVQQGVFNCTIFDKGYEFKGFTTKRHLTQFDYDLYWGLATVFIIIDTCVIVWVIRLLGGNYSDSNSNVNIFIV